MAGEELLIVDTSDADRENLRRFFDQRGYVCTAVRAADEARNVLLKKFFPAALVDLDVEKPGGGLEVVRFAREQSPETSVVLLTGRRSFEAAVGAHRLGVVDIVVKAPDQVEHLRRVVEEAAIRYKARHDRDELYREIRSLLNDAFKVMLEMARRIYVDVSAGTPPLRPRVMFVDGDGEFLNALGPLVQTQNWEIIAEMTGGAALDRASRERVDILVVRNELPDLRGSMVIKTIQGDRSEVPGLLYTAPGPEGRIDRLERGQVEGSIRPFTDPRQLVEEIRRAVGGLTAKAQERRLIQAFRNDHPEFLRRFAQVKRQIDTLLEE